jgi:hypothetical protein
MATGNRSGRRSRGSADAGQCPNPIIGIMPVIRTHDFRHDRTLDHRRTGRLVSLAEILRDLVDRFDRNDNGP